MDKYDRVAKVVAPKQAELKIAEVGHEEVMVGLCAKQAELKTLLDKRQNMEDELRAASDKKNRLEAEVRERELHLTLTLTPCGESLIRERLPNPNLDPNPRKLDTDVFEPMKWFE